MDASEICSKRLNAKEVIFPKEGEFIFPIADGRIKILGGDQDRRTSILTRQRPIQEESHLDFLGESEGSLPQPHDSFPGNFKDVRFYPIFIFGHFWAALLKMSGFTPPEILAIFWAPPWSPF